LFSENKRGSICAEISFVLQNQLQNPFIIELPLILIRSLKSFLNEIGESASNRFTPLAPPAALAWPFRCNGAATAAGTGNACTNKFCFRPDYPAVPI
jgi:hypothetical protein